MAQYVNINKEISEYAKQLRGHIYFNEMVKMLEKRLEAKREVYEENQANEFTRGQINELKDLLQLLK